MVLKTRSGYGIRVKCISLPLIMGFIIGCLSVYTYYLLMSYEDDRKFTPVSYKEVNSQTYTKRRYHRVDMTKPSKNHTSSLLCLIFINDIDSLLMQRNVWLDKCVNTIYMSKEKHQYIDNVVTDTYSLQPWKYYCQTLMYLDKNYNSNIIKYDWIFLAKDNLWLIYENLIHLIALLDVNKNKHNYYAGQFVDGILSTDAGVLFSINTLSVLVRMLNNRDACNTQLLNSEGQILDFYLSKLNVTPVNNMDIYGCSLFNSINLFEAFNVNSLKYNISKICLSRSAISYKLELSENPYAIFYKYVLYKTRLINQQDLTSNNNLPPQSSDDIWRKEALYELNFDPQNMSQTDFNYYWSKKRQIIL